MVEADVVSLGRSQLQLPTAIENQPCDPLQAMRAEMED